MTRIVIYRLWFNIVIAYIATRDMSNAYCPVSPIGDVWLLTCQPGTSI